jgi:hypothetical protein
VRGELAWSALVWEHDATVEDADGRAIRVRLQRERWRQPCTGGAQRSGGGRGREEWSSVVVVRMCWGGGWCHKFWRPAKTAAGQVRGRRAVQWSDCRAKLRARGIGAALQFSKAT